MIFFIEKLSNQLKTFSAGIPVSRRCHSILFPEGFGKLRSAAHAAFTGNGSDGLIGMQQEMLSFFQSFSKDEFMYRFVELHVADSPKHVLRCSKLFCQERHVYFLIKVFADKGSQGEQCFFMLDTGYHRRDSI